MSTRTTLHRLVLASAVAAMLAAAPSTFAQVADTPGPTGPTPTSTPPGPTSATPDTANTTTPSATPGATTDSNTTTNSTPPAGTDSTSTAPATGGMSSTPMSGMSSTNVPTPPMNLPTDYKILNNRIFDGTDLEQARARGLSDTQIATIVKISKETLLPFNTVTGMVERGETFPAIATTYNLKLSDVYSNDKEKQEVSDYDALNKYAKSLGRDTSMSGGMSSMPMSGGSAPMTGGSSSSTTTATPVDTTTAAPAAQLDIVQTAMAAKNLTTLVKALQIAGLVDTLKGAGPFTVFAPDDKAFAKLPAGALDALEADPVKLKQVLTYHVIPANVMAADAMAMTSPTSPPTVEGATLQVTKGKKGRLKINDATVTKADIKASNGTIHIINMVLMPPASDTAGTTPAPADTTTPPAAPTPMDATPPAAPATPPAAPATPGTTDATPPAAPAAPGATDTTPPAAPAAPSTMDTPPVAPAPAPATPGQ